jgi:hypothetical protein
MKIQHVGFTQLALATAITVAGCPSPDPVDGGFVDAPLAAPDTGPLCGEPAAFEIGSPEGHPSPLGAAAGEARAGRVTAADLPADPARLATWSAGDYVLANDRVALVVSSAEHFDVYDPHGGRVRGLARVEGGRLTAPADFNLAMLGLGRLVVGTTSVTVLHDGRDGAPATIRVAGTLVGIQALGPLLETLFVSRFEGLPVALDFVLEPDASMVDVRIALRTRGMQANVPFATTAFFQSFRMPVWNETGGFAAPTAPQRYMLFEDADASSFAWVAPANADGSAGSVSPLFSTGGFDFFSSPAGVVPPCTEQSFALGRFAIGERNGMNGVQRVIARELGESTRRIEGVLTSTDPLAIAGARVHLTRASDDAHLTRALVDATGAFDLVVPSGEVEAWVWREGVGLEGPFVVPPSGPVSVALAPPRRCAWMYLMRSRAIRCPRVYSFFLGLESRLQARPALANATSVSAAHGLSSRLSMGTSIFAWRLGRTALSSRTAGRWSATISASTLLQATPSTWKPHSRGPSRRQA